MHRGCVHCVQAGLLAGPSQNFGLLELPGLMQPNLLIENRAQFILSALNLSVEFLPLFRLNERNQLLGGVPKFTLAVPVSFEYLLLAADQKSPRSGAFFEHSLRQQHRQVFLCDLAGHFVGSSVQFDDRSESGEAGKNQNEQKSSKADKQLHPDG
jgi:hypothetical protein